MKLCKHGLKLVNGAKLENTQTENTNIKPGLKSCGYFFGKGEEQDLK